MSNEPEQGRRELHSLAELPNIAQDLFEESMSMTSEQSMQGIQSSSDEWYQAVVEPREHTLGVIVDDDRQYSSAIDLRPIVAFRSEDLYRIDEIAQRCVLERAIEASAERQALNPVKSERVERPKTARFTKRYKPGREPSGGAICAAIRDDYENGRDIV